MNSRANRVLCVFSRHQRGGRTKRLYMVVNALLRRGYEVHYIAAEPLRLEHSNAALHAHLLPFSTAKTGVVFWIAFTLLSPLYVLRYCITHRIAAILVFDTYYALISAIGGWLSWTPIVLFMHTIPWRVRRILRRSAIRAQLGYIVNYLGFQCASRVVSATTAMQEELCEKIPSLKKRVVTIPGSVIYPTQLSVDEGTRVPADQWARWLNNFSTRKRTLTTEYGLNDRGVLLVTCGELSKRKNVEHVIRAIGASGNEKLSLVVCGDGSERGRVRSLIIGYGLTTQVALTGWLEDPSPVITGSDVLVVSSRHEGVSHVMLEALGAGAAVIAADTPEMREVLQFDELLFDPQNVEQLSQKLTAIVSKKGELERLKDLSHERARHLSFDWGQSVVSLLEEVL